MDERTQRRAWVTGASSGIGESFARRLALEGWDLVLVARRGEVLEQLGKELEERHPTAVEVVAADLATDEGVERVELGLRADPRLELLVNNAGFGTWGRFHELDPAQEARLVRLNCEALVRLTHAGLQGMVERRRGAVVNVSSGIAFVPAPFNASYGGSKAFVNSFTEAISEELQGTGVQVQVLCPGFTRTEFQERAGMDVSAIPGVMWQDPDEVAAASLQSLRRGQLFCIPGRMNRATLAPVRGALSRAATRRILAAFGRRQLGK